MYKRQGETWEDETLSKSSPGRELNIPCIHYLDTLVLGWGVYSSSGHPLNIDLATGEAWPQTGWIPHFTPPKFSIDFCSHFGSKWSQNGSQIEQKPIQNSSQKPLCQKNTFVSFFWSVLESPKPQKWCSRLSEKHIFTFSLILWVCPLWCPKVLKFRSKMSSRSDQNSLQKHTRILDTFLAPFWLHFDAKMVPKIVCFSFLGLDFGSNAPQHVSKSLQGPPKTPFGLNFGYFLTPKASILAQVWTHFAQSNPKVCCFRLLPQFVAPVCGPILWTKFLTQSG